MPKRIRVFKKPNETYFQYMARRKAIENKMCLITNNKITPK